MVQDDADAGSGVVVRRCQSRSGRARALSQALSVHIHNCLRILEKVSSLDPAHIVCLDFLSRIRTHALVARLL
jgi:hypothetical protein